MNELRLNNEKYIVKNRDLSNLASYTVVYSISIYDSGKIYAFL